MGYLDNFEDGLFDEDRLRRVLESATVSVTPEKPAAQAVEGVVADAALPPQDQDADQDSAEAAADPAEEDTDLAAAKADGDDATALPEDDAAAAANTEGEEATTVQAAAGAAQDDGAATPAQGATLAFALVGGTGAADALMALSGAEASPAWTTPSIAIVLAEASMTYTAGDGACGCPMCKMMPADPTGFGQGDPAGGNVGVPGPAGTLNTLATYLNERNSGSGGNDFWDDFWGGGSDVSTPFFNLTGAGTNAKNGVIRFNLNNSWYDADGIEGPNATTRREAIRNALDVYEDILGIDFVETSSTASNQVDLAFGDETSGQAFANFNRASDGSISNAWINIAQNWSGVGDIGDYYFHTALHEIGHVLGLGHQGNYNAGQGSLTWSAQAVWSNDTIQYTMMSYWHQANYTIPGQNTPSGDFLGDVNVIGPQAVDWLALDRIYNPQGFGIDDGATTGDTTWGFNSSWGTSNAPPLSNLLNNAYRQMSTLLSSTTMTIADGGGNDTLDLSGFANNTRIDLRITSGSATAPSFSNVAGLNGNLAIAVGTVIENAIGGAGAEVIYGNTVANELTGNAGNDTIHGDAGNDTLYGGDNDDDLYGGANDDTLKGGGGADLLEGGTGTDVLDGLAGDDRIRLRSSDGSFANEAYIGGDDFDTLEVRGAGAYDLRDASLLTLEELEFAGEGADIDKSVYLTGSQANGLGAVLIDGNNSSGADDRIYIYLAPSNTTTLDLSPWTFVDWDVSSSNTDTIYVFGNSAVATAETVTGSSRSDFISLYGGNDSVNAGAGADSVYGGDGNDTLVGGAGTDALYGGNNNDDITSDGDGGVYYGGNDNDFMRSGIGSETMDGGNGTDTIDHRAYDANYTFDMGTGLTQFAGELFTGFEVAFMGDGNDSVTGTTGADTIYGGEGNDTIAGLNGLDTVYGGNGDDTVFWRFSGSNGASGAGYFGGGGIDVIHGGGTFFGTATFNLGAGTYDNGSTFTQSWVGFENYFNNGTGTETVIGSNAANRLETGSGNNRLEGGSGADTLLGGGGNDTLLGGFVTDDVYGGDGDDLIQVLAGEFYDNVYGGIGTDTLDHSASTYGGTTFDFGAGTMTGAGINGGTAALQGIEIYQDGSGANTIVSSGASGVVLNGNDGNDTMIAANGDDDMHGGAGIDLLDLSVGNFVYTFDTDTGESVEYGSFESFSGFEQFLFGSANDTISTSADLNRAETVTAGGGDDTVIDRSGTTDTAIDTYDGGDGTDTITYTVNLFVNHSIDLSQNGLFFAGGLRDTLLNFENVTAENVGVGSIIGNDGANVLTATGAFDTSFDGRGGDDHILAGDGNDTLDGGAGSDTLEGQAGNDVYIMDGTADTIVELAGEGTDEVRTAVASFSIGAIAHVENLTGTSATGQVLGGNLLENVITGAGGNDSMFGGSSNDTLNGNDGDDLMNGGTGADSMLGGDGNDTYVVDNAGDSVNEAAGQGTDTVLTNLASFALGALVNVENLTGTSGAGQSLGGNLQANVISASGGNDSLFGGNGDDTMTGGGGADLLSGGGNNDLLDGGLGVDTMNGGAGDDVFIVDNVNDRVIEAAGGGTDEVRTGLANYSMAAVGHVENLTGTSGTGQSLGGNVLNNTITALGGNDSIFGGGGDDTMNGGSGDDLLVGGANNDSIIGGLGNDTLNGGTGIDTMNGGGGDDTYFVDDAADVVQEFNGTVNGVDTVRTNLANFSLAAVAHVENLVGIVGTGQLLGGSILNNAITGAGGNDSIFGGGGDDTITGGAGDDLMNGGPGADVFVFDTGFGNDSISGFNAGAAGDADVISISSALVADFATVLGLTTDVGAHALITIDASTSIMLLNVQKADLDVSDFAFF